MPVKLSANLDLLRALAVLLVLAQHLAARFRFLPGGAPPIGTFGVLLFFVHTCLVLMYSMERSGLDGFALGRNFYVRRLFRIYPLSILAVLTAVVLHLDAVAGIPGVSKAVVPVGWGRIFSNIFLVQNLVKPGSIINVLWSLPLEVQMYVFLPFLFLWSRGRRRPVRWLCLLWFASVVIAVVRAQAAAMSGPAGLARRLSLLEFVPNFIPGIIAFALPHQAKIKSYLWVPFLLVLTMVYVVVPRAATGWFLCLALGFAIPFFEEIKTAWLRSLGSRIATYSYGIYLSHQFCIWVVADILGGLPLWIRALVLMGGFVGIPIALYHLLEKPMIKLGVKVAGRLEARPPLIAVSATETAPAA